MRRRVHGRLSRSSTAGTARPGPTAERLTLQTLVVDWAHNEWDRWRKFLRVFRKSRLGMLGLILLLIFVFMAASPPLLTGLGLLRNQDGRLCGVDLHPCAPTEANLARYIPPNGVVWLGTGHLGRDNFARPRRAEGDLTPRRGGAAPPRPVPGAVPEAAAVRGPGPRDRREPEPDRLAARVPERLLPRLRGGGPDHRRGEPERV